MLGLLAVTRQLWGHSSWPHRCLEPLILCLQSRFPAGHVAAAPGLGPTLTLLSGGAGVG